MPTQHEIEALVIAAINALDNDDFNGAVQILMPVKSSDLLKIQADNLECAYLAYRDRQISRMQLLIKSRA